MRIDIVRHVRGWNFHRIDRGTQRGSTWAPGFSYSFTITRLLVIVPLRHRFTPPWESWQPSSFKVTNKAMVSVGETFASCCSGFGNPSASVRGARRGKNSWSRSLHQYRAAIPSLRLRPSSRLLSFIIISVLIDS